MKQALPTDTTDITVNAANSPYMLPSPAGAFGTVTIQAGGYIEAQAATSITITSLVKTTGDGVTIDHRDVTQGMRHFGR